jgi:hypothetical protein
MAERPARLDPFKTRFEPVPVPERFDECLMEVRRKGSRCHFS